MQPLISVNLCILTLLWSFTFGRAAQFVQGTSAELLAHHYSVHRGLQDFVPDRDVLRRLNKGIEKMKEDMIFASDEKEIFDTLEDMAEEHCPGSPFMWKIVENSSGKHVGFVK